MKQGCPYDLAVVYDPSHFFKWWVFTTDGCLSCYFTRFGANRKARRIAKAIGASEWLDHKPAVFKYGHSSLWTTRRAWTRTKVNQ